MIIDQLPLLSGDVESTDEIPIERGTTTYKTTQAALVKSAADAAAAAQSTADAAHIAAGDAADAADAAQTTADGVEDSLATYPRPNLLENWYFVGGGSQQGYGYFPLNSNGQTSYIGAGDAIDRWYNYQSSVTSAITSDGISIARSSGDFYSFVQKVNSPETLRGKTVTATLWATGHNRVRLLSNGTSIADSGGSATSDELKSITGVVPNDTTELLFVCYTSSAVTTIVKAAKLEIGSTQTLAHQESGVWVLNEVPSYGEEYAESVVSRMSFTENISTLSPASSAITLSPYTCCTILGTMCLMQFEFSSTSAISSYTSIITGFPTPTTTANLVGLVNDNTMVQLFIDRAGTTTPGHLKSRASISANAVVRVGALYAL